jgi:drug/metabolite transporter (DMT)-like permease
LADPAAPHLPASRPGPRRPLWATLAGWAIFIALETAIQVVFKIAGRGLDADAGLMALVRHAATTPVVWLGFGLYYCGFLMWMTLLKELDLGRAFPLTGMVYVATFAAAVLLFHERANAARVTGTLVIVAGVVLLAFDENSPRESSSAGDRA